MTESFPSDFVDEKSGKIVRFERFREKLGAVFLPQALRFGFFAAKASLLVVATGAAFAGGLAGGALMLGAVGGGLAAGTLINDRMYQRDILRNERNFTTYNLADKASARAFNARFGKTHPNFAASFLKTAAETGLKQVPLLKVLESAEGLPKKYGADMMSASAMSGFGGKNAVITVGRDLMDTFGDTVLTPVVAHEIAHLKTGLHRGSRLMGLGSTVLGAGLLVLAGFGFLPLLATGVFVAGSALAEKSADLVTARYRENISDRAAALVTGDTSGIVQGLKKIETDQVEKIPDPAFREAYPALKQKLEWLFNLVGDHHTIARREKKLSQFAQDHAAYLGARRRLFAEFDAVSAPRKQRATRPRKTPAGP